jgi:hypothetical protein
MIKQSSTSCGLNHAWQELLGIVADFNGVVIVQNYLQRAGRDAWMKDLGSSSF